MSQRRLAIIDLSPGGAQPKRDGENLITYNGEIYNYLELREEMGQHQVAFQTSSDTEVLIKALRAMGNGCADELRGMFAFAFWNEEGANLSWRAIRSARSRST